MNPLIDAPPKMNIANNTTMVDNEVLNVRRSVEFNASLLLVHRPVSGIIYVLTDTVEYNHGIVDGVTYNRQYGSDKGLVNLQRER